MQLSKTYQNAKSERFEQYFQLIFKKYQKIQKREQCISSKLRSVLPYKETRKEKILKKCKILAKYWNSSD